MRLAIQEHLIPGRTLSEKLDTAASMGFEGIELLGSDLLQRMDEITKAFDGHSMAVSSICAGFRGCPLDTDKAQRDLAMADVKRLLEAGGELGAVGLIFVPVFGPPRLPDLSPHKTAVELEREMLVDLLGPAAETARKVGCLLLLEPLNRYETHLLRTLADAAKMVNAVNRTHPAGRNGCAVMADFFHMSIEEDDIPTSILRAGRRIRHVHLADSQRMQPGTGHTAFRAGFRALRKVGFTDFMALECGIRGKPAAALPECVKFLRRQLG